MSVAGTGMNAELFARTTLIRARLEGRFGVDLRVATTFWAADDWRQRSLPGRSKACGWDEPVAELGRPFALGFCPELIAASTAHLALDELGEYLDLIELTLELHLCYWGEIADPIARRARVEQDVAMLATPAAMATLAELERRAPG